MGEVLVFKKFLYISLAYLDFSERGPEEIPARKEYAIFNNGMIRIREGKSGTLEVDSEEILQTDPYEVASLYYNIKNILENDEYDKETLSPTTKTTDIRFEICYSSSGHGETCSPFLADENGITILSVIDGFIAFARKEHTYYNWYEVVFSEFDSHGYSYFYDDDSIKIGDKVIVPTGPDNKERTATVINFWRLSEERLPYPAEKTKRIIRKIEPPKPFSIDEFLKKTKFTIKTDFEFTDVDGHKMKGNIYGDYREDPDAKEPYLKCFLQGGTVVNFVESRISSIKKIKS